MQFFQPNHFTNGTKQKFSEFKRKKKQLNKARFKKGMIFQCINKNFHLKIQQQNEIIERI